MANWKYEVLKKRCDAVEKALQIAQEEVNSLKDVMFAFVKMNGRIRIPKEIAETLREDDNVKMARSENGDWTFEFVAGSKEVKSADEIQLLGTKSKNPSLS